MKGGQLDELQDGHGLSVLHDAAALALTDGIPFGLVAMFRVPKLSRNFIGFVLVASWFRFAGVVNITLLDLKASRLDIVCPTGGNHAPA